jgi:hypothetical protein
MTHELDGGGFVIDTPEGIAVYRDLCRYHALRLEARGLRRHGRSVLSICREAYGLQSRTAKAAVLEFRVQLEARGVLRSEERE